MHTALVVKVNVSGGRAGLSGADAGVEMQPLPAPAAARNQSQDVDVDVVQAAGGYDLRRLGKLLPVRPRLADKVVVDGGVAHLALDHRLVIVLVVLDEGHDLLAVPVVTVLRSGEVDAQTPVVAAPVSSDITNIISDELKHTDMNDT